MAKETKVQSPIRSASELVMAKKAGNLVTIRLKWCREYLDSVRHYFPDLPLTPAIFDAEEETRVLTDHPQLEKAATFFGLDLRIPAQRELLLVILADVLFFESKKGRPSGQKGKWDRLTLIQLAVDCNKVKEDIPRISDRKAAGLIKDRFRERYKHVSVEMIRQKLKIARVWLENEYRIRADRNMPP